MVFGSIIASSTYASEVYIDQAGGSTTIDITQTGTTNKVNGDSGSTTKATISGDTIDVDITQTGNYNEAEVNITGGTNTLDYSATGDSNTLDIFVNGGTGGTHSVAVTGDGNGVTICGTNGASDDSTGFASITSSGTTTAGTACSTGISANDVTNTVTIGGDYNLVNIEQGSGVANSANTITIGDGVTNSNNNVVNLVQKNTEANTVDITIDGSDNAVNVIQN